MGTTTIILIAAVVIVGGYFVATQRSLVGLDELINNAFSQIGVQLTSRWDLVTALVKMVEKYSKHEHDTLQEVVEARRMNEPRTASDVEAQESAIGQVLGRIIAIGEQYPELKAAEVYQDAMSKMGDYEDKVRMSRMVYNDAVTKMNRAVRQFPSSLVASLLHFGVRDYLKVEEKKQDYPDINV